MEKNNICPLRSNLKEDAECIGIRCTLWVPELIIPQGETEYVVPGHCSLFGDGAARQLGHSRPNADFLKRREERREEKRKAAIDAERKAAEEAALKEAEELRKKKEQKKSSLLNKAFEGIKKFSKKIVEDE